MFSFVFGGFGGTGVGVRVEGVTRGELFLGELLLDHLVPRL